mgnify:FL=1
MARLGFVGAGLMGHGMAANLLKAGHGVRVIAHCNRAPVDDLLGRGATEVRTLAEMPLGLDAIFLCVTGTPQVDEVITAIEPSLAGGQLIVDTSTSEPDATLRFSEQLARRGVRLVDAPIGGGAQQAKAGELSSMVGASDADFTVVEPWLRATSKTVQHMGPVGSGHRAKLLNNMISLGYVALIVEAYRIARAEGIDWAKLYAINMGGAARSATLERMLPPAMEGDFGAYKFTTQNADKDLSYLMEFARRQGHAATLAEPLRDFFRAAAEAHGASAMLSELLATRQ